MLAMCARYHSVLDAARLQQFFRLRSLRELAGARQDVFPGYAAPFIRGPREWDSGDEAVADREARLGRSLADAASRMSAAEAPDRLLRPILEQPNEIAMRSWPRSRS